MGDGCLGRHSENPFLIVSMISPNYLHYLNNLFGVLGTGVVLDKTAEEAAKENDERDFHIGADPDNYHDVYRWWTRTHPEFHDFDWYTGDGGVKVWPEDIELTPTTLKHWYCGDGHYSDKNHHHRIEIGISNEIENIENIDRMFERADLPTPSNYKRTKRKDGSIKGSLRFSTDDSDTLFDYMGEPLPDFEYKFPL